MMIAANEDLGERISAARRIRGISVGEMAKLLHCPLKVYRRVEAGREPIQLVMGAEISVLLKVNLSELLPDQLDWDELALL